jgi:hypothetical protein
MASHHPLLALLPYMGEGVAVAAMTVAPLEALAELEAVELQLLIKMAATARMNLAAVVLESA